MIIWQMHMRPLNYEVPVCPYCKNPLSTVLGPGGSLCYKYKGGGGNKQDRKAVNIMVLAGVGGRIEK